MARAEPAPQQWTRPAFALLGRWLRRVWPATLSLAVTTFLVAARPVMAEEAIENRSAPKSGLNGRSILPI